MKDFLKKLIAGYNAQLNDLQNRNANATTADELRAINAEIQNVQEARANAQAQLDAMNEERTTPAPKGAFSPAAMYNVDAKRSGDIYESIEYRKAFMNYVLRHEAIPAEFREDAITHTTDVATVIPTNILNRIIEKLENIGGIYAKVTKTFIAAGVAVPTSSAKPVATWVAEGAGSDKQKKGTGSITFARYKLRCEIAMTQETSVLALPIFEATFVRQVTEAMVKAIEEAIINGDGSGKPKGILAETPEEGQAVEGGYTYATICAAEAALPEEYENGAEWTMNKKTWMKIAAMVDDNGQPIARVTVGLNGKPEKNLLGRPVTISGHVTTDGAFIFNYNDYLLNQIYDLGIEKRRNWNNEDEEIKAVMSVDGKVIDKNSLVTVSFQGA